MRSLIAVTTLATLLAIPGRITHGAGAAPNADASVAIHTFQFAPDTL